MHMPQTVLSQVKPLLSCREFRSLKQQLWSAFAGLPDSYQFRPCEGNQNGTNAADLGADIVDFFESLSSFQALFNATYYTRNDAANGPNDNFFRFTRNISGSGGFTGSVDLSTSLWAQLGGNRRYTFCGNQPWMRYASLELESTANRFYKINQGFATFPATVYRGTSVSDSFDLKTLPPFVSSLGVVSPQEQQWGEISGNFGLDDAQSVIRCNDATICQSSVCGLMFAAPISPLSGSANLSQHPLASIGVKVGSDDSKQYQWVVKAQPVDFGSFWSHPKGLPGAYKDYTPVVQFSGTEATTIEKAVFSWFGPAVVRATFDSIKTEPVTAEGRAFAVKTGAELATGVTFSTCKAPTVGTWNCKLGPADMDLPAAQRSGAQTIASDTDSFCRRRFFMSNPAPYTAMPLTLNYKEVNCGESCLTSLE